MDVFFCLVDSDLFEPPRLRLNFFWQVVELAFSINKVHKKIFPLLNFFIYYTIIAQSVSINFGAFFSKFIFFIKIKLQYLRIFHHNYIHR